MISEATRDMVTETTARGRFTYASTACKEVLGHAPEDLVGTDPLDLHHPDDIEAFVAAIRAPTEIGVPFSVPPHRLRRRDGSWVWVEATGVWYERADGERRLIGVARDITARLEAAAARGALEEQVRRAQKLESLGALTGGIAHDFNNLLTPILGAAGLLLLELPEDSPWRKRVATIEQAAKRAASLTGQMLAYAGGAELELRPVDVSEHVRDMMLLLESSVAREATLGFELESCPVPVLADPGQLSQVIVNLVVNASEALGASGKEVVVRTGSVAADRALLDACALGEQREPGCYGFVEVCDDGAGIEPAVQARMFDPFFSTKFTGRGLGLAMVVGIVRGHGGALQVETAPGAGTRFRILLPASETPAVTTAASPESRSAASAASTPDGALLVVDDDDGARELVAAVLERGGFEVMTAMDGSEAIRLLEEHGSRVSGIVLDATMPGLSGEPLLARIRALAPEIRVLLVSGYAPERLADVLLAPGGMGFLPKPFEPEQLVDAVRQLFDDAEDS